MSTVSRSDDPVQRVLYDRPYLEWRYLPLATFLIEEEYTTPMRDKIIDKVSEGAFLEALVIERLIEPQHLPACRAALSVGRTWWASYKARASFGPGVVAPISGGAPVPDPDADATVDVDDLMESAYQSARAAMDSAEYDEYLRELSGPEPVGPPAGYSESIVTLEVEPFHPDDLGDGDGDADGPDGYSPATRHQPPATLPPISGGAPADREAPFEPSDQDWDDYHRAGREPAMWGYE